MVELALRRGYATNIGDLLDQVALYRQSNPYNGLLAVLQRPHAKLLLTDEEWELKWGRRLRPNEHPIVVLDPYGPLKFVFDVSQTEPSPTSRALPADIDNPYAMKDVQLADVALSWLKENAKHDGVRVLEAKHGWNSAGCIWNAEPGLVQSVTWGGARREMRDVRVRFETLLNSGYNPTEKLATLAHELGHLYCGTKALLEPTGGRRDAHRPKPSVSSKQSPLPELSSAGSHQRRISHLTSSSTSLPKTHCRMPAGCTSRVLHRASSTCASGIAHARMRRQEELACYKPSTNGWEVSTFAQVIVGQSVSITTYSHLCT